MTRPQAPMAPRLYPRAVVLALTLLVGLAVLVAACRVTRPGEDGFGVQEVAFDVGISGTGFVPTLEGPLRVLAATPHGPTPAMDPRQPVTVTFTRPMVSLGEAPPPEARWLRLDPAVAGDLSWEGTQTLVFTPEAAWPAATGYTVHLAAGIESLDGEALAEPARWSFETPRPQVVSSLPARGEAFAIPTEPVDVRFNQAVDARRAAPFVRLVPARGREVDTRVTALGDSALRITPRAALQKGTPYRLQILPGLPSGAGPLATADTTTIHFTTLDDLRLVDVDQPRHSWQERQPTFDARRGVRLTFSTPVSFEAVRQAVSLTPAAVLPAGIEARDGSIGTEHVLPFELDPETNYTLAVGPLTDVFGQRMTSAERSFRTRALEPSLQMPEGILVIEAEETPAIPVRATNVAEANFDARRLAVDDIIPLLRTYDRNRWYGPVDEAATPHPPPARERLSIPLPRNRPGVVPLRLDAQLRDRTGIVAVRMNRPAPRDDSDDFRAIAQVTRLSLSAKFSPHQNLFVVSDLATATPIAGVAVHLRDESNRVLWRGTTDRYGKAEAPGWHQLGLVKAQRWQEPMLFAFAERGGDLAFTSSRYNDGVEPYRFGLEFDWSAEPINYSGSVFTDRGLYRAGETAFLKAVLRSRTDGDWRATQGDARLVIRSPRDEVVFDRVLQTSAMGSLDLEWTAPPEAAHGMYEMRIGAVGDTTLVEGWTSSAWATGAFRVDAFRAATFEVTPRAAAPAYVAGDFFEGTVDARYLFGAPVGGQDVRVRLIQTQGSFTPEGFDAFRFGALAQSYRHDILLETDTTLTDDGALARRLRLPVSTEGLPTELRWEATVTDGARQQQFGVRTIPLHPGQFYVGLRPRTTYLDLSRDRTMPVDVITLDPSGMPVATREVTVELIKRQWNSVREVGSDGRLRWRSEMIEDVVQQQRVATSRQNMTRVSLPVTEGGSFVVRATSRDVRGNTVRSEAYFWAAGSGYVAWERADDERIDLIPEKTSYRPGETARLMVQSPYERATALVTVEREGIMSSRVIELEGSAPQIEVPLTEDHLPNVFVSVVLYQGRVAPPSEDADAGAPSYKIGYANLRVDPGSRRLTVEVEPDRAQVRPGDEVTVNLRLVDARGRGVRGEIAFSAADAAVLNLIGYRLPDPFDAFYGPRPLAVTTTVGLANLVRQRSYGQKEEDQGGGGGDRSDMMRRDFRPLAHWAPALQTDGSGRARVTFRVPESMTTFRLMASAHTADHRFGAGSADLIVQKPLVMQPALPRFARLGDTFEAGVLITNLTGAPGAAVVQAEAGGLVRTGPAEQRVQLAANETREVRFGWRVDEIGDVEVRFSARLGDERDALAVSLPVALPTTRDRTGTFASTDGRAAEAFTIPGHALRGLGGLRVTMSSTALAGLDGAARYLFEFPYGCVEQQTSRIRPLLLGREMLDAFDLTALDGDRDAVVRRYLADLDAFWTGDGFSMWRGQAYVNPYASGYVVLALAEARDAGYTVPDRLTADAVDYLERTVRDRSRRPAYFSEDVWNDTRALMLFALARHGRVLTSDLNDLIGRADRLSPEGVSYLLRSVLLVPDGPLSQHRGPLADRLRRQVRVEATGAYVNVPETGSWGWIFASDTRATAHVLVALVEADASSDTRTLSERMIRYLMRRQTGGAWASTQDNAAVIDALRAHFHVFERERPDVTGEVRAAGQRILRESFSGRSLRVAEATRPLDGFTRDTETPVTVEASGAGRIYYSLALDTYSAEPQQARSSGLGLIRTIQPVDAQGRPVGSSQAAAASTTTLDAGQLVRVTIRLTSPSERAYVVVDDALPAGLEALNAAFETTDRVAADHTGGDRWWGSFNHSEIRDDRVLLFADWLRAGEHTFTYLARATTPGTYVHPPAQAEAMYDPEIMGRTATRSLIVQTPP